AEDFAVDDGLLHVALASGDGIAIVRPDDLAPSETAPPAPEPRAPEATVEATVTTDPVAVAPTAREPLPDAPLVRFEPVATTAMASTDQIVEAFELELAHAGARAHAAIAEA